MLFVAKKWLEMFLTPIPLCFLLIIMGLILVHVHKRCIRFGHALIFAAVLLLVGLSTPSISAWLLTPLEQYYPAFQLDQNEQGLKYIIVLGGGQVVNLKLPLNRQLNDTGKARMDEGIRLFKAYPQATLLVTGCCQQDPVSGAEIYARYAEEAGVPRAQIQTFADVKDTNDEAKTLAPIIQGHPAALVTSASHMRRAMSLFERVDAHPIPAPTYYLAQRPQFPTLYEDFPSARYLFHSQVALHEWLGLLWGEIRN